MGSTAKGGVMAETEKTSPQNKKGKVALFIEFLKLLNFLGVIFTCLYAAFCIFSITGFAITKIVRHYF
jgi:hypothetical protein